MKDSIKKQSLPDLAGINARLYESLSFFMFRSVKINFLRATGALRGSTGALSDVLASLYRLIT